MPSPTWKPPYRCTSESRTLRTGLTFRCLTTSCLRWCTRCRPSRRNWRQSGMRRANSKFAEFAYFLLDSQTPQARLWQRCYQLARLIEGSGRPASSSLDETLSPIRRILTITAWSMFGNFQVDGTRASPAQRLTPSSRRRIRPSRRALVVQPRGRRLDPEDVELLGRANWHDIVGGVARGQRGNDRAGCFDLRRNGRGLGGRRRFADDNNRDHVSERDDEANVIETFANDLTAVVHPFKYVQADRKRVFRIPTCGLSFEVWTSTRRGSQ